MLCPNCEIEMGGTFEPYEYQCEECGYWFDAWTGEVLNDVPHPIPDTQAELPGMSETLKAGEPRQEWSVRYTMGFSVYSASEPTECAVCRQKSAYEKSEAGYPGLYHCTACSAWVDKTTNEAWRYEHFDSDKGSAK